MIKRSVTIAGHRTSVSLEEPFWLALQELCAKNERALAAMIVEIDARRGQHNLSSAIRLYVLEQARKGRLNAL